MSGLDSGFLLSSANPRLRSFSAILWMADLGARVWVSVAELRIVNLEGLRFWEMWVLGNEKKGEKDRSVEIFGGSEEAGR